MDNEDYDKWQEPDDKYEWVSLVLWYGLILAAGIFLAIGMYTCVRLVNL